MPAGNLRNHPLAVNSVLAAGVRYRARLTGEKERGRGLKVGFFQAGGSPFAIFQELDLERGSPVPLRVIAEPCGAVELYQGSLELIPMGGEALAGIVRIPLEARVEDGLPGCGERRVQTTSRGLLLGLVALYVMGLITHSHFVSRKQLAMRLRPLRWEGARAVPDERSAAEVARLVARDLNPWRRAKAWFLAKPWRVGLFGESYHETVELQLQPRKDVLASSLTIRGERNLYSKLERDPGKSLGLFATALDGLRFFAVLDRDRIGRLVLKGLREPAGGDRPRLVRLQGGERLLHEPALERAEERQGPAGWRI